MMTEHLYKYFRFNEYLKSSFEDSYLWFSDSDTFNDPFEFKLYAGDNLSDEEIIEYYYLMKKLGHRIDNIIQGNIDAFLFAYKTFPKKFIEYYLIPFNKRVRSYGICCFSEKLDNILMWSHYADSHRGLVLEFDKTRLEKSLRLLNSNVKMILTDKVKYDLNYPLIKISRDQDATAESVKNVIYTKSINWEYESEIRTISTSIGRHYFELDCITGIFMGSRFKDGEILMNMLEAKKLLGKIQLYKMKEREKSYELEYIKN